VDGTDTHDARGETADVVAREPRERGGAEFGEEALGDDEDEGGPVGGLGAVAGGD
jgi:hypothetical protein